MMHKESIRQKPIVKIVTDKGSLIIMSNEDNI